ncbi:MAG: lysophospholipid acyltransferase family protein [Planctomycetota bacterium]|nr:lysophospholipid acyltransferase family protein [Planctomycetota bacterium]
MLNWMYSPAADLNLSLGERLKKFPREPHMWMYLLRSVIALCIRFWLKVYHRFSVVGQENLPLGKSFVLIANHQSHLDALCLTATIPFKHLHKAYPVSAADYFFSSLPRCAVASVIVNGLPFDRKDKSSESLEICRQALKKPGTILILFPEGTRSESGQLNRFRSGIGRLLEGTGIPAIPCYLDGAYGALPKGSLFPRPKKLTLRIGPERQYSREGSGRETVKKICHDLQGAVKSLRPAVSD